MIKERFAGGWMSSLRPGLSSLGALFVAWALVAALYANYIAYGAQQPGNSGALPVPAYHSAPPSGPLPPTLDPKLFAGPVDQRAYALAAKIKAVLYQQPCYCHCDHFAGHGSLLDCFVDRHASVCVLCKKEGIYAYLETKKGKTPRQIRAAIIKGDWQKVDLEKYATPLKN